MRQSSDGVRLEACPFFLVLLLGSNDEDTRIILNELK